MQAITTIATPGETAALCHSVGVSRATLYRHRRPSPPPPRPRPPSPRALGPTERQAVLDVLHSPRFVDQSPTEVHATLLDEQTYLCSPRTMYRVLAAAHEVRERRAQARHPAYAAPELVATGPNQVWSWDITKLKGPVPVSLLLALCDPRPLQPLRRGLDGRAPRECAPGRAPAGGDLREAGHHAAPTHHSRGPRCAHAQHTRRAALLGPGYHRQSFAAPREQRQSVLRSAVPDREVPAGVSGTVRRARTRAWRQPRPVCVVQRRAPSQRPELSDARRTSTTAAPQRSWRPVTAHAWPPMPPIPSGSCTGHPVPRQCPRRSGSIGRRPSPARWPQPRPPSPRATHSRAPCARHHASTIARARSSPAWSRYSKC